jgi:uncharacterized protein YyaL (SSP411 family)
VTNRLASATSLYLRQHKDNPVDWWPWSPEPFAEAARRQVPVFISIGYSACHWCHVMAHESFEDPELAEYLNERFVSIKVDREERPDIDALYMEAVQAMTGRGGWPMTVFTTPDGRPFYGGTYFPSQDGHGLPSFKRVLEALASLWQADRGQIEEQAGQMAMALRLAANSTLPAGRPDYDPTELVQTALAQLARIHDDRLGGFGRAPKFPQPAMLELVLTHLAFDQDADWLSRLQLTLDAMAAGGIYDHLAGGFARYSTDARWLVPHFEKMLYDQAGLARAYLHAYQLTKKADYRQVTTEVIDWVLSDLALASGGLASALDADSSGREGAYYLFDYEEVVSLLGSDDHEAIGYYGITRGGNFEGANILYRPLGSSLARPATVEAARVKLLAARRQRPSPGRDEKVLTEWNAMMLAVLAEAGTVLERPDWVEAAQNLADFLSRTLRRQDGRWMRSFQSGRADHLAFAADYAWLVEGFVRLYQATGQPGHLHQAIDVADAMLSLFSDPAGGGLFSTGADQPVWLVRQKEANDGATPSATSVAAAALGQLAALTGFERFEAAATDLLAAIATQSKEMPLSLTGGLAALLVATHGHLEVVIPGHSPALVAATRQVFRPNLAVAAGPDPATPSFVDRVEGLAYVCHRRRCLAPVSSAGELAQLLEELTAAGPPGQGRSKGA